MKREKERNGVVELGPGQGANTNPPTPNLYTLDTRTLGKGGDQERMMGLIQLIQMGMKDGRLMLMQWYSLQPSGISFSHLHHSWWLHRGMEASK